MKNLETELVSNEINGWTHLRPITYVPLWRRIVEAVAFAAVLIAVVWILVVLA
jgi:hypothetical protein